MKAMLVLSAAWVLLSLVNALGAEEGAPTGAAVSEPGLVGRSDIVWFEDFEAPNWKEQFTGVGKTAELTSEPKFVFGGRRALVVRSVKGEHGSVGASVYLPQGFDRLYVRYYIYFPEGFLWGQGRYAHLKLFSQSGRLSGGRWAGYTSAGIRPTGRDKFSATITAQPKTGELQFYFYHPDQRGGYGDIRNWSATLGRGRWHSLETMVKVNTVGQKDGEIAGWLDGKLVGEVKGLRFRDIEDLRIRSVGFSNYWGGAGPENTAPADQVHYIDNMVIATDYIGPAQRAETPSR